MTASPNRRQLLKSSLLLSFCVAGNIMLLTPAAAKTRNAELQLLSTSDALILETLCERLVPGAADAGISFYIDAQLNAADSLLMLTYLGFDAPHAGFYRQALDNIQTSARKRSDKPLTDYSAQQLDAFIAAMAQDQLPDWQGLPASLVYFVLRADALDVRYGTQQGFADLNIPYMAHIAPKTQW